MSNLKNTSLFIHVDKKTWTAILDFEKLLKGEQNHALQNKWKKLLGDLGKYVIFIDTPPRLIDDDNPNDGGAPGSYHRP
jgi:hypothetical protein